MIDQSNASRLDSRNRDGALEFEGDGVAERDREATVAEDMNGGRDQSALWKCGAGLIPDDHESSADDEPSLGAFEAIEPTKFDTMIWRGKIVQMGWNAYDQTRWGLYSSKDLEGDDADEEDDPGESAFNRHVRLPGGGGAV